MKVCVLLPDYSTTKVDYQYYDPPRYLNELLPGDEVDTVFLNKLTTYKQLKDLSRKGYDVFVNLCEGYLEWEVPSIDVPYNLELLNLPFTGPTSLLYDPPKPLMKYVVFCSNVKTPFYSVVKSMEDAMHVPKHLKYPLFIKPAKAGDSLGVDEHSLVNDETHLYKKIEELLPDYESILVEEYIKGREFTVLVAANADGKTYTSFKPIEYVFPEGREYKTYALKTSELHPNCNVPCNDSHLEKELRTAAEHIFKNFNGEGYARLDFRVNDNNEIYFLEINFTCSVFYTDGYEGSADYILKYDGIGKQKFLQHLISEGISRYQRRQKKYVVKGNSINGFGLYATKDLETGEIVFQGEGRAQRIITKTYVEKNWNVVDLETFKRYAYPVSSEVFILWDNDPSEWAPQNHSCDANTGYSGLNVVALKKINRGDELTLDYGKFLDDNMMPFHCTCGSPNCRGLIAGKPGTTPFSSAD